VGGEVFESTADGQQAAGVLRELVVKAGAYLGSWDKLNVASVVMISSDW
jgi:hypothetical protein